MKKIVAVYRKKGFRKYFGFVFDTNVQNYVENFMQKVHVGTSEYSLFLEDEAPEAHYTEVTVIESKDDEGNPTQPKFLF